MYYLWNCSRQGWVSSAGTSTELASALQFESGEAFRRCQRAMDYEGNLTVIPVSVAVIEAIRS